VRNVQVPLVGRSIEDSAPDGSMKYVPSSKVPSLPLTTMLTWRRGVGDEDGDVELGGEQPAGLDREQDVNPCAVEAGVGQQCGAGGRVGRGGRVGGRRVVVDGCGVGDARDVADDAHPVALLRRV
jgi:hypothetical protein